jgi:hypothetical protein
MTVHTVQRSRKFCKASILDFHRGMNTDFWFWGFCTVCKINFLMAFREPLWVPSSMVIGRSVREQRIGMPPYIGVGWVWVESSSQQYQPRGRATTKQNLGTTNPTIKKKQTHIQAQLMLNHTSPSHYTTPFRWLIHRFPSHPHFVNHSVVGPLLSKLPSSNLSSNRIGPLLHTADSAHTHSTPI